MSNKDRFDDTMGIVAGYDQVRHAAYPTASRTLCGLLVSAMRSEVPNPRGRKPDCRVCRKTAEEIDSLDRSAPAPWFRHSEPPATCQGWADAYGRRCRKKIPAGRDYCANHEKQAVPA